MPDESVALAQPFEIVSVQRTKPPSGGEGSDWHRYIIVQGTNTIHGYRQGNLGAVTSAVEEIVAQLNDRRIGKRGRVQLMTTRKKSIDK
ncbi:MAG: hypothetical protein ACE5FV_11360 [Woeseia sp.]